MVKILKSLTGVSSSLFMGALLLVFGGILVSFLAITTNQNEQTFAGPPPNQQLITDSQKQAAKSAKLSGIPTRIVAPSVNIDLQVIPGYYYPASQKWTLSLDNAQYGTMTAPANDHNGMTFIYAHYRKGVFLNLSKIKMGETVRVYTDTGYVFTYALKNVRTTNPNDTELFNYQGKPILVLQTCSGTWFQNRQLYTFNLVRAE